MVNKYICQYDFEDELIKYLRLKDMDTVFEIYQKQYALSNIQELGDSYTRSLKNNLICTIYHISRIICPNHCLKLKDLSCYYISKIESERSLENISNLGKEALVSFSEFLSFHPLKCSNKLIFETISYVEENLGSNLTLDTLASRVHVSKNYLSSIFAKQTGMKLTGFISSARISKSKELLKSSEYSLEYISDLCGFKNQSYFSTVFKKLEHKTPLEYKTEYMKNKK